MKRLLFVLAVVFLTATAYGQKGKYVIKGSVDDKSLNGAMAILQKHTPGDEWEIDSCVVRRGKFSFKGEMEGNIFADIVFIMDKQDSPYLFGFVLEPGTLYVDHFHKYDDDVTLRGTPLNDKINAYLQASRADTLTFTSEERARMDTLVMAWNYEIVLPTDKYKEYSEWYDSKSRPRKDRTIERLWNLYHQNEHNLLALYAIDKLESYDTNLLHYDFVDSLLRTADTLVKNVYVSKLGLLKAQGNTSEGKSYVDIPGTVAFYREELYRWVESDGSLKDIIDGKLAIVDFWSSWCGPCRQEIRENLVPLYNKYKDQGLVVVGVDVWDQVDNFYRAVGLERIKYPQLIDTNNAAARLYGFDGIPEILLIAPDGTILARGIRGNYIEEAILKALKKEN